MDSKKGNKEITDRWDISTSPYLSIGIIARILKDYFEDVLPIDSIIVTDNFKRELLRHLRETDKVKYLKGLLPFPSAETVIPSVPSEGFKIIMDSNAYKEEFHAYLGLIHEFCHIRDLEQFYKKYGYVHAKPLKLLRRLHYPEFLLWTEYVAVKDSFEYTVDLFGKIHPQSVLNLDISLEVKEMLDAYNMIIEEEKKEPRFADAIKLETSILLERFIKQYFAGSIAKIELKNSVFKENDEAEDVDFAEILHLNQYIFESDLMELAELLRQSNSYESVNGNLIKMSKINENILKKLKRLV
jgi:hypothetical protein